MANNKPSAKFKAGGVSVALWPTEITANGRTITVLKASLDKRYKDNATGEWKSSSSLSRNEVGQAVLCLVRAYAAMMEKSTDEEEVTTE
ncbi:MAG: hypothetical protein AABZ47_18270 [Planctomycetota bacterium]